MADAELDDYFFGEGSEGEIKRDENGCVWRFQNGQWEMLYIVRSPDPNGAHAI